MWTRLAARAASGSLSALVFAYVGLVALPAYVGGLHLIPIECIDPVQGMICPVELPLYGRNAWTDTTVTLALLGLLAGYFLLLLVLPLGLAAIASASLGWRAFNRLERLAHFVLPVAVVALLGATAKGAVMFLRLLMD